MLNTVNTTSYISTRDTSMHCFFQPMEYVY